ncbi:MAG: histidinol phosphatase [Syntrophobacteraceae bacterium CG23_combo_of_CG06-09_8_20_14_all_50_8]|nr:MAG: histidinol phosphatase [Syntrophobacteraceae bacterium CG23_combo_of_CG06-09_8_20_14_all_50_8]
MMRTFRCDLHIHTCLSPCADLDMYPRALVKMSLAAKLVVIAICDHNASENVRYVLKAAEGKPIRVLPGMEITSSEEVHLLALFDNTDALSILQDVVYGHLPGLNNEAVFGCQAIVNDRDEVEGFNERLLIGATVLPLQDIIDRIHSLGGLAIASHIDRESFSVLGQLGFIDEGMHFDALEVSCTIGIEKARSRYPDLASYPMIASSDAHFIQDIGRGSTRIRLGEGTVAELKMAFQRRDGRCIME